MGDNLSGWSAAQKEPVINASACKDLGFIETLLDVPLENALIYPLLLGDKCLGTISIYGAKGYRFKEEDVHILRIIAEKASPAIQNGLRFQEAEEDAVTDPLTLLPNLRYLQKQMEQELARAKRHNHHLCVLAMDLDGFKEVNDTYGHQAGDRLLMEVAHILRSTLRTQDVVVRQGGDEFVAMLYRTHTEEAIGLAARIQEAIDCHQFEVFPGKIAEIGISLGCASFPEDGDSLETLMKMADGEMYRDKATRRRCRQLLLIR
jgi:diguanylate cyclase (GGDEF)-like protein